jgi:hypothetical protein
MNFFYYIFYRIYSFYEKKELDKTNPEIYASAIITLLQMSTLVFLFGAFNILEISNKKEFMCFWGISGVIIMIFNAVFLFTKNKYEELKIKWGDENKKTAYIKGVLIVFWIFLIFPFILSGIYFMHS